MRANGRWEGARADGECRLASPGVPGRASGRPFAAAWRFPRVSRTASRVAGPRGAASPPESSRFPVSPRGSAGIAAWPGRGPVRPSPPARPDARSAAPPASPPSPKAGSDARRSRPGKPARSPSESRGDTSVSLPAGLGARGSIVAIGDAETRLGLLGHHAFPAGLALVVGAGLDQMPPPGYQHVDTLQCIADALAEPWNLDVVSNEALPPRLPRPI